MSAGRCIWWAGGKHDWARACTQVQCLILLAARASLCSKPCPPASPSTIDMHARAYCFRSNRQGTHLLIKRLVHAAGVGWQHAAPKDALGQRVLQAQGQEGGGVKWWGVSGVAAQQTATPNNAVATERLGQPSLQQQYHPPPQQQLEPAPGSPLTSRPAWSATAAR